jgi:hypothetical protein
MSSEFPKRNIDDNPLNQRRVVFWDNEEYPGEEPDVSEQYIYSIFRV